MKFRKMFFRISILLFVLLLGAIFVKGEFFPLRTSSIPDDSDNQVLEKSVIAALADPREDILLWESKKEAAKVRILACQVQEEETDISADNKTALVVEETNEVKPTEKKPSKGTNKPKEKTEEKKPKPKPESKPEAKAEPKPEKKPVGVKPPAKTSPPPAKPADIPKKPEIKLGSPITNMDISVRSLPAVVPSMVRIEGTTTADDPLQVVIRKDSVYWYKLPVNNGKFGLDLYLTDGEGEYDVWVVRTMADTGENWLTHDFKVTVEKAVNKFLVSGYRIESDNPSIVSLAKKLTGSQSTDSGKIKAVYDWTRKNITYDYGKAERMDAGETVVFGAAHVLQTRTGICEDYACLAAALLRAVGIQAKVITGTATTSQGSGLHAWNAAYDSQSKKWIYFDATWASTSGENWFNKNLSSTHKAMKER